MYGRRSHQRSEHRRPGFLCELSGNPQGAHRPQQGKGSTVSRSKQLYVQTSNSLEAWGEASQTEKEEGVVIL